MIIVYRISRGVYGVELTREMQTDDGLGKGVVLIGPEDSQKVYNHSPDGFECGYDGSGPAQLALAILLHFFGGDKQIAIKYYQDFKNEFIATMPREGGLITEDAIENFLEDYGPKIGG